MNFLVAVLSTSLPCGKKRGGRHYLLGHILLLLEFTGFNQVTRLKASGFIPSSLMFNLTLYTPTQGCCLCFQGFLLSLLDHSALQLDPPLSHLPLNPCNLIAIYEPKPKKQVIQSGEDLFIFLLERHNV